MSKLYVVGIGPGDYENMTIRADRVLHACDLIVGYTVYVDLVREHYPDKEYMSTPMTREVERCRMAIEQARAGKNVAMICSGDSGIYGMAALILELLGEDHGLEVEIIPGLTAACSGAALLGAPLTHDFAVISLSDRLTPWEKIRERVEAAAKADLSVVLYNPRSKGRPDFLRQACDIMLQYMPADRPCGVAQRIGREGENIRLLTLQQLRDDQQVDMFTTVFVGNAMTKVIDGRLVTPRGYRNV